MGCFKIVATPAYLRSNFQTSLNYGVRLFQNTCFDFFHSPSEDCLDCFQVLLSYYLIDSYWYVGLYIYFKIYFYLCVCECESMGIQRACGGQRTTFLASVCSFCPVLEAGFLIFPTGCICEGLGDFPISIWLLECWS